MRLSLFLFYLLILFLPAQLARHFFLDFTTISGIRSDYLTPTIYLTDIIALALIIRSNWSFWRRLRAKRGGRLQNLIKGRFWTSQNDEKNNINLLLLLIIIGYLLFNVIFIATNQWAALYKLAKILEFIFLGIAISRLKPKLDTVTKILSIGVFYSSIIAIWQFLIQRSIGGIFWWLGERTFYAGTPGIAAFSYKGNLLLRPYATFPHPNVLGGFLAVVLPLILFYSSSEPFDYAQDKLRESRSHTRNSSRQARTIKRIWLIFCLITGFMTLILTFSRTSWLVALIGFLLLFAEKVWSLSKKIKITTGRSLSLFYLIIFLSVFIPVFLPQTFLANNQYWQERVILLKAAITMVSSNLMVGLGLNNSIIHLKDYINYIPGIFIFQPIHNIYLLIISEIGILGFATVLLGFLKIFLKTFKSYGILLITIIQLFLLGLFDHYLYTVQQGQLLLTFSLALALSSRPSGGTSNVPERVE